MKPYDIYIARMGTPAGERVDPRLSAAALTVEGTMQRLMEAANTGDGMTLTHGELMHIVNILIPSMLAARDELL